MDDTPSNKPMSREYNDKQQESSTARELSSLRENVEGSKVIVDVIANLGLPDEQRKEVVHAFLEATGEISNTEHLMERRAHLAFPVKRYLKGILSEVSPAILHRIEQEEIKNDKTLGLNELIDLIQVTIYNKSPGDHAFVKKNPMSLVEERRGLLKFAVEHGLSEQDQEDWKAVHNVPVRGRRVEGGEED